MQFCMQKCNYIRALRVGRVVTLGEDFRIDCDRLEKSINGIKMVDSKVENLIRSVQKALILKF